MAGIVLNNSASGTATSFSFTVGTGSNRLLVFGFDAATAPSGITYNGVALTLAKTYTGPQGTCQIWYLIAPASGANTLAITGGTGFLWSISDWTNAGQDYAKIVNGTAGTSNASATSLTATVTTTINNSVQIGYFINNNYNIYAGANTTLISGGASGYGLYYSTSPVTPAGSNSISVTCSPADLLEVASAAFADIVGAPAPVTTAGFFQFM